MLTEPVAVNAGVVFAKGWRCTARHIYKVGSVRGHSQRIAPIKLSLYKRRMARGVPITDDEEATIKAALTVRPHASAVARKSEGMWSYSTVWRVADRWNIVLTEGRETMGCKRLSAEQVAAVREMSRSNPKPKQADIARATAGSRPTVSKIEGGRRYRKRSVLSVG
jgi:hypothetical protein